VAAWMALAFILSGITAKADVIFDTYSAYHHIQVLDARGLRTLSFNNSRETMMSLSDPMTGHFEYTEYFHMPWLWNSNISRVAMVGLGGGSTQRSFLHYYTNIAIETVELDPVVVDVAKKYFQVVETPRHKIHVMDGRLYLRRNTNLYDLVIMDAYSTTRYGSSLPPHLTTKEFFTLASQHMPTNGVLAYNVIGQIQGWRADIIGSIYRTMKEVFPNVYLFPAQTTMNVVFIATKTPEQFDSARLQRNAGALLQSKTIRIPNFTQHIRSFTTNAPPAAQTSPVLTDDRAPVEGLMGGGQVK
jgi:spermidine synthase